jgi:mitogen-activated protein kinase kinase kinase
MREGALTLRRTSKTKRSKGLAQIFGERPPASGQFKSPTTPHGVGPKSAGDGDNESSLLPPIHGVSSKEAQTGRSTKRASTISILSGLGVPYPEKSLDPPLSPSQASTAKTPEKKTTSKLRNFFGQRPPSELITTHLTEYFPSASKRVLRRTARQSMMRTSGLGGLGKRDSQRDSTMSWNPPLPSRFSSSTQGSQPRMSMSSLSSYAAPDASDKETSTPNPDDIPRISLSTDNSRSVDIREDDKKPSLLPPVKFPSESFSESVENLTGDLNKRRSRPVSSNASKRMSYMTELRSKRDRSDTASMMTVDEITAEVESRRESMALDSTDDWTQVGSEGGGDEIESSEATLAMDEYDDVGDDEEDEKRDEDGEYEDEELDDDEEETLADDAEEPAKRAVTKGGQSILLTT